MYSFPQKGRESELQLRLNPEGAADSQLMEADEGKADLDIKQPDGEEDLYTPVSKPAPKTGPSNRVTTPSVTVCSDGTPGSEDESGPLYSSVTKPASKSQPGSKVMAPPVTAPSDKGTAVSPMYSTLSQQAGPSTSPPVVPSEEDTEYSQLNQVSYAFNSSP